MSFIVLVFLLLKMFEIFHKNTSLKKTKVNKFLKHDRKQSNYFKNRQVEESNIYLVFPIDIVPQSNQIVDIGKFLLLHRSNPNISHKKIELCHSAIPKY